MAKYLKIFNHFCTVKTKTFRVMKKYLILLIIFILSVNWGFTQDVGISGGFFASMINVSEESELHVTFTNNSFDTTISPFGAYVQVDFPTTGEYSAPNNPPTGPGAQNFDWTQNGSNPNIWIGIVNSNIPPLSSHLIIFTVVGEGATNNTATFLFTDLSSGSDNDSNNNNAEPLLQIQGVLPVEFIDFTANNDCDVIELDWSTASEVNNAGFELLFSTDGKQFDKIAFINGQGESHNVSNYSYSHDISKIALDQSLYYRLKQIDKDGQYSFSKTVYARKDCDKEIKNLTLGPNPTNGNINFIFNPILQNDAEVTILNRNQQLVKTFFIEANTNRFIKDIGDLVSGVYFIKINTGDKVFTEKVILID